MHLLFLPANPCLLGELQWHLKLGSTEKFSTHQLWASVWGWAWADAKATGKAHRKCQQVLLSNRLRQFKKLPALCWCNLLLPNCWSRPGTLQVTFWDRWRLCHGGNKPTTVPWVSSDRMGMLGLEDHICHAEPWQPLPDVTQQDSGKTWDTGSGQPLLWSQIKEQEIAAIENKLKRAGLLCRAGN